MDDPGYTPTYSINYLPEDMSRWHEYRKKTLTKFIRIYGPFNVKTAEGLLRCQDGYLGIDARGYPYPVAKEEFDLIYEKVDLVHGHVQSE